MPARVQADAHAVRKLMRLGSRPCLFPCWIPAREQLHAALALSTRLNIARKQFYIWVLSKIGLFAALMLR